MRYIIKHESRGRLRVGFDIGSMSLPEADALEMWLGDREYVEKATVHERTCCAIIRYKNDNGGRDRLLAELKGLSLSDVQKDADDGSPERVLRRTYEEKLVGLVFWRGVRSVFLPPALRAAWYTISAAPFVWKGIKCILRRKLHAELLDAISIGISVGRGDYDTAGSVMFLLKLGELLEEWTHKRSANDLAKSMALNVDRVWIDTPDGEVLVSSDKVKEGDIVIVRTGGLIPFDGTVIRGDVTVNQSSLTGESIPVARLEGSTVYAGTVIEEGECAVRVKHLKGENRYDRIVSMIEQSEKLKSKAENRALRMADKLVPYTLVGSALVYGLTRNAVRALSVLMVDFSCALKLSVPLSVLSAMREAGDHHILVKGGKYLEAVATADTIVFDKTGTLTYASPEVVDVIPFDGKDPVEMLRLAACLEEHFPHSMANAVVEAAKKRGLQHDELHSKVEYIVAHGIASMVNDERVTIGSHHFLFEDEGCEVIEEDKKRFTELPAKYSHLYLAVGGKLAAVICIYDPLKKEAKATLDELRTLGLKELVMLTGDSERTAASIAEEVGVDAYRAEVLPEDKAAFVKAEKEKGHKVIMIGDGINDSPALSEADVGIAVSDGAAIAREIADITIVEDDLHALVELRILAMKLMQRIDSNYRSIIGFNGSLIGFGALGVIAPSSSALLHNLSTLGVSLKSMTRLL